MVAHLASFERRVLPVPLDGGIGAIGEADGVLARTRDVAKAGPLEEYETTAAFDATSAHPECLGPA